ncbi:MAG: hypothetical protein E7348_05375 [Clostridiales bacterium]|nr:hypothetical protein [Clostridiales bacterium]
MEKDLRYVELFELYQGLLTEKQREMFLSHYCYDLSLAEIAEPEGSTRQSVYAVIKTVKEKLDEYEQKLGFLDKNQKLVEIAKQLEKANKDIADKILDIVGK